MDRTSHTHGASGLAFVGPHSSPSFGLPFMHRGFQKGFRAYIRRLVLFGYHPSKNLTKTDRNASAKVNSLDHINALRSLLTILAKSDEDLGCIDLKYEKVPVKRRQKDLLDRVGFYVEQVTSCIPNAGLGVRLHGKAPKGAIVAVYPGTVYAPGDPAFFQSLGNSYILRCYDGLLVDGKRNGLSGRIFRSLYRRHHPDPHLDLIADQTWMEGGNVANPYAIGQIINNATSQHPANVHYQELNIPPNFPLHLRKYISNIHYAAAWRPWDDDVTRVVLLIANRDIEDDELFSTYHETVG
ncbi:uncharacterized protein SPPG_08628 [Spizellomyces punctatus DAOM BR117]|uniref:SET domain-containing protein n=1 Tax=Spizellomyces punctatus (strain DAOM BR117) TaxID=645134 RepID=A0A0L0H5P1_SPIPD|nr:uncharacterized protein SPPG_08628 [Spizellomyces punctatus DAOM BR117]KNC96033.1 hypothetical protein SPPG_08628 [Spizellomyces punctatus DAOM BR117]|eukprot:XP_016604073.1 hypothetical protein SPPG_08628 [Spizellomyces punctatus DAOM BR117]